VDADRIRQFRRSRPSGTSYALETTKFPHIKYTSESVWLHSPLMFCFRRWLGLFGGGGGAAVGNWAVPSSANTNSVPSNFVIVKKQ
jgi:hypothetical protein